MRTPSAYQGIVKNSVWLSEQQSPSARIPEAWLPWLLDRGSLTAALVELSHGQFRVRVLSESWRKPLLREARKLGIDPQLAVRVREVELLCNEQVMVFARSIIPLELFQREQRIFQNMGSKPLGHLLFKDGRVRNSQRDVSIYRRDGAAPVYGRATPYQYHRGEILVSEFFVNPELVDAASD